MSRVQGDRERLLLVQNVLLERFHRAETGPGWDDAKGSV